MTTFSSVYRLTTVVVVATGLLMVAGPVLALEVNNNAGSTLTVEVNCDGKQETFQVPSDQVGHCPSNVCNLGTTCSYTITAGSDGSCTGKINGGSGLQVSASGGSLSCESY